MSRQATFAAMLVLLAGGGCAGVESYFRNGWKVGENYTPPCAPVKEKWIDADSERVRSESDDLQGWWTVFDDPKLNELIWMAHEQNLTLREAGYRILSARAQLGIAQGNFFPQLQAAEGGYSRVGAGESFFDSWDFGFNLGWELDFWGRYRRAIAAGEANLDASIHDYDDVLVTLLADVATTYVQIRTNEEQIRLAENTLRIQQDVFTFLKNRLMAGALADLDVAQAESNLEQSRAQINELRISLRIARNQLCILLGIPPEDLTTMLAIDDDRANIPKAPEFVVVGIPAELLARRPDVRRAERQVAFQAEQIGIAEADWYPTISISGTLGWSADSLSNLFTPQSLNSSFGPSFQWNLLNYGRILSNVELQRAEFLQLVTAYQTTVLQAQSEAENGIVTFLESSERADTLEKSVTASYLALGIVVRQYEEGLGGVDFNRYATILQTLVQQQNQWAQSRGEHARGLIDTYPALGGGWEIRLSPVPDKRGILSDSRDRTAPPAPDDEEIPIEDGEADAEPDAEAEVQALVAPGIPEL